MFDAYFLKREVGLTKAELLKLASLLPDGNTLYTAIEVVGNYSVADGFISDIFAEAIDYDICEGSPFYTFIKGILDDMDIKGILDDMDLENPECVYEFSYEPNGLGRILLTRDIQAALATQKQSGAGKEVF